VFEIRVMHSFRGSAQHLQDSLQGCECFDVLSVMTIPDATLMPTYF